MSASSPALEGLREGLPEGTKCLGASCVAGPVGRIFPPRQLAAALALGSIALVILGLQPQLLGAMAAAGRLDATSVGLAATAELVSLGTCTALAALLVPSTAPAAWIGALAALGQALAMVATPHLAGAQVIVARALAGSCEGVMLWLAVGLITRSRDPERWSGVFFVCQTGLQLAMATLFSLLVLPRWGVAGAWQVLALLAFLGAGVALGAPLRLSPLRAQGETVRIVPSHLFALAGVGLHMAFLVTLWVYLHPLALAEGLRARVPETAVAAALGAQVLGGALATVLGPRWPLLPTLAGVGLLNLAILALLGLAPGAGAFTAAIALFGGAWLFVMPFHVRFLIAIDPSRRVALGLPTAQLAGSSLGPLLAALLVAGHPVGAVLWLAGTLLLAGTGLVLALGRTLERTTS